MQVLKQITSRWPFRLFQKAQTIRTGIPILFLQEAQMQMRSEEGCGRLVPHQPGPRGEYPSALCDTANEICTCIG